MSVGAWTAWTRSGSDPWTWPRGTGAGRRLGRVPDQRETPLASAAEAYLADEHIVPFTTPGHKRAAHLGVSGILRYDLPLSTGADDLHLTGDVLGRAER